MQLVLRTDSAAEDERRLREASAAIHAGRQQIGSGVWLSFEDPWGNRLGYWESSPPK